MPESVRRSANSVVEVREGAPVAGTPARARGRAGGAQTLALAACEKAVVVGGGWRRLEKAVVGHRDGGGGNGGGGEKIGSLPTSERKKAPRSFRPPASSFLYIAGHF